MQRPGIIRRLDRLVKNSGNSVLQSKKPTLAHPTPLYSNAPATAGMEIEMIQKFLGHASLGINTDLYSHLNEL